MPVIDIDYLAVNRIAESQAKAEHPSELTFKLAAKAWLNCQAQAPAGYEHRLLRHQPVSYLNSLPQSLTAAALSFERYALALARFR